MSPFHGKDQHEILTKNKDAVVTFPEQFWTGVSAEGHELVTLMLQKDPSRRITAADALQHRWFLGSEGKTQPLSSAVDNMRRYHNPNNQNRFNVERIKPEFSMVSCTPMLASRFNSSSAAPESPFNFNFRRSPRREASPGVRSTKGEPPMLEEVVGLGLHG
jgi:serine/threonine protein kinase